MAAPAAPAPKDSEPHHSHNPVAEVLSAVKGVLLLHPTPHHSHSEPTKEERAEKKAAKEARGKQAVETAGDEAIDSDEEYEPLRLADEERNKVEPIDEQRLAEVTVANRIKHEWP